LFSTRRSTSQSETSFGFHEKLIKYAFILNYKDYLTFAALLPQFNVLSSRCKENAERKVILAYRDIGLSDFVHRPEFS
jgi:hypothetical protein